MRNTLGNTVRCLITLTLTFAGGVAAQGQSRDLRVVKAVAGGVNFVSGDVKLQTSGQSGWRKLTMKDDLKSGDILRSGTDGRAEVLLNPGSYLRLGFNSEMELTDASLDDLRLKLFKGSAVIEATGYDGMPLSIAVGTPQTAMKIIRQGIYRINVTEGVTEVAVRKGRAIVGREPAALVVKGGKVARVGAGGAVEVAKLDKKNLDALDSWSKERGDELAKMSAKVRERERRTLLASASFDRFYGRFGHYGNHGVWLYNAANGCYTFLSFYGGWASPYGSRYGSFYGSYPCWNCGSNSVWNDSSVGTMPTPQPKVSPPVIYAPNPATNPIPVTRGSSDGGYSPSTGKSKP